MKPRSALVPVIAGFGVMLLLLLAVTAIGVAHIRLLSNQLTAIVSERNQKSEIAATLHGLHESRHQSLMLAASHDDAFARDAELMRFSAMALQFIQLRDQFLGMPLEADELDLWNAIRAEVRQTETFADKVVGLLQADRAETARALIEREVAPRQQNVMRGWSRLLEMQRAKNRLAMTEAYAARGRAQTLSIALSAAALVVGGIIALFVVRLSRRLEKELFEEKERAQVTLQSIGDAVVRIGNNLNICYLNPVAESLLGIAARNVVGQPVGDILRLFDRNDRRDLTTPLCDDVAHGRPSLLPPGASLLSAQNMEFEVEGKCSPCHTPEGDIHGGVLVLRDVTEARELQRKLLWQANHDGLTGLANRHAFEEKVSRVLTSKRASEFPMSLLFIDLDRFKQVNDAAGHAAGDLLLRQLGGVMQARIREVDVLARIGGDEFAIMLLACPHDVAENIAKLVRDSVANFEFTWEDARYRVGASIGVVHVPPHWQTLDECLAAADAACYKAKQNGRNDIVVHGK